MSQYEVYVSSRSDVPRAVRAPARASADSLAIAYRDKQGAWRRMCPDFIFFEEINGVVKPSIVDPHGLHLEDALPKLIGLAAYAEKYADVFHRIEAIAVTGGSTRIVDLTEERARDAIQAADDAESIYRSSVAADFI